VLRWEEGKDKTGQGGQIEKHKREGREAERNMYTEFIFWIS
jgi:hypothetical protein